MDTHPLVFTDLDGTLLDHFDYSFEPAKPLLAALKDADIAVIPNTSKTCAELLRLRERLSLDTPFIVENGAAVYIPMGYFPKQPAGTTPTNRFWVYVMSGSRYQWTQMLSRIRPEFDGDFTGLSELSIEQLMDLTGLDKASATLASQRQYGEPIVWRGSESQKKAFIERLTSLGGQVLEGGRFIHLSGQCDKGLAMKWLKQEFAKQRGSDFYSIALGDGKNDIAMLEAADQAVVVRSPVHEPPKVNSTQAPYVTQQHGPAGWAEALSHFLSDTMEVSRHG